MKNLGRLSRRKGHRGELEAARKLVELFGCEAHRGRQYQGGDDSPDVKHSIPDVHFEVKRRERLDLWGSLLQAKEEAGDKVPVVLHRANGRPWIAIVPLDDLPRLVVQLYLQLGKTA